ncbi:MAG: MBL fold metallo-hydrolase [Acidimicrobiia bacterium]|nr:MBL fold metallo-hydrolase [Acidimicrobiia bacterium]
MRVWMGLFALVAAMGATIVADTIPAQGGNIELTPLAHAHVQLEFGGKVIHLDPSPQAPQASIKPADLVLITDIHGDHMDPAAIDRVKKGTTIYVAPPALADRFPGKTELLKNGETRTVDGVSIQAVAAYNLQRGPSAGQFYHEKGRANAYLLTLGGQRILFTGDTECTPEIKALTKIDIAFVTMNLPFTMPPDEAAACVKAFRPRIVYPYHYRQQGLEPANKNQTDFVAAMKGFAGVEVRTPDMYPAPPAGPGRGGRGRGGI